MHRRPPSTAFAALDTGELAAWSANQYLGCLLTFVAAGVYSYLKATAKKPPPPVEPSEKQPLKGGGGQG